MSKPEDIANGARDFARSEFGKWYMSELRRKAENYIDLAQGTDAHHLTVNSVMRSAGLQEALKLITQNEGVAESNLFKK